MSPSSSNSRQAPLLRADHGFTLAEILVAMAIFLSLMAGVALLFGGTVDTVRGSYQLLEAFDVGRSTIDRIDADLKGAFSAPEYGDYYNFYGTPMGFTYVGTDADGRLGRVTYALHPNDEQEGFDTVLTEDWNVIDANVQDALAHQVQLAAKAAQDAGQALDAASLFNAWHQQFRNLYPPTTGMVEFNVHVTTYSLVRYAERGVNNLDVFPLPGNLQWPTIDPRNDPVLFDERPNLTNDDPRLSLYEEVVAAIQRSPGGTDRDLRRHLHVANDRGIMLKGLTFDTVEALLASRKRELWMDQVNGMGVRGLEPFWTSDLEVFQAQVNGDTATLALLQNKPNVNDYIIGATILRRATILGEDGLEAADFYHGVRVGLDAIDVRGIFNYSNGHMPQTEVKDVNGVRLVKAGSGYMVYADAYRPNFSPYFNDARNIRTFVGYEMTGQTSIPPEPPETNLVQVALYEPTFEGYDEWRYATMGRTDIQALLTLDEVVVDASTRRGRSASTVGSPLLPKLPAVIQVNFTIFREKTRPAGADFRQVFSEAIDIPTAINGGEIATTLVAAP